MYDALGVKNVTFGNNKKNFTNICTEPEILEVSVNYKRSLVANILKM